MNMLCALLLMFPAQAVDTAQLFQQAVTAQRGGDNAVAIRTYREILKSKPDLMPALINLGVASVQAGQFGEAIESYRKALAIEPGNRAVQTYLALAFFKQGDTAAALRGFEELYKTDSHDVRIATLLAACALQIGDAQRALAVLEPFMDSAADDQDYTWALATTLIANGRLRAGAEAAERVAAKSNAAEAWMLAGQNLLASNEFVRARTDLENAVRLNASLPGVLTALGQAREKNADYDGAIQAYASAVKQNAKDFDGWLGLGSDQYFVRNLPAARVSLKQALLLNAESAPALYAMALVDKADKQAAAAVANLEKAVALRPDWLEAHVQLAALYTQLHRTVEGARERQLVDNLTEQQRARGPGKN